MHWFFFCFTVFLVKILKGWRLKGWVALCGSDLCRLGPWTWKAPAIPPCGNSTKKHLLFVEASFLKVGQTWGMKIPESFLTSDVFCNFFQLLSWMGWWKWGWSLHGLLTVDLFGSLRPNAKKTSGGKWWTSHPWRHLPVSRRKSKWRTPRTGWLMEGFVGAKKILKGF